MSMQDIYNNGQVSSHSKINSAQNKQKNDYAQCKARYEQSFEPKQKEQILEELFQLGSQTWQALIQLIVEDSNIQSDHSYYLFSSYQEKMENKDKNAYNSLIQNPEFLFQTIQLSDRLDIIAKALKNYHASSLSLSYSSQNYGSKMLYSSQKQQIGQFIKNKIFQYSNNCQLNFQFRTTAFENLILYKEGKIQTFSKQQLEHQKEIMIMIFENIIEFFPDFLEYSQLSIVLIKYLAIFDCNIDSNDYKYIDRISEYIIKGCKTKKGVFEVEDVTKVFNFMLNCLKLNYSIENDPIKPHANFYIIFDKIPSSIIKQLMEQFFIDIMCNLYVVVDVLNILQNLIQFVYTDNITLFMLTLFRRYEFDTTPRYDYLHYFYLKFIKKNIFNKLRNSQTFNTTIEIIKMFVIGFSDYIKLEQNDIDSLLGNCNFVYRLKDMDQQKSFYHFLQILQNMPLLLSNPGQQIPLIQTKMKFLQSGQFQFSDLSDRELGNQIKPNIWKFEQNKLSDTVIQSISKISNQVTTYDANLKNLGNSCYMDSVLTSLFMTKPLRIMILNDPTKFNSNALISETQDPVTQLNQCFFKLLKQVQNNYFEATQIKKCLSEPFKSSGDQQDVTEFFNSYLAQIEASVQERTKENFIQQMFSGEINSNTKCLKCNKSNHKTEDFKYLSLYFLEESYDQNTQQYDMIKMLKSYFENENLNEENQYYCDSCEIKTKNAVKRTNLEKIPPIFILTLNRFQYNKQTQQREKINYKVDIKFDINISDFIGNRADKQGSVSDHYRLYAFIIHIGSKAESGHYVSYARDLDLDPKTWYHFDDLYDKVQQFENISNYSDFDKNWSEYENCYMLFYQNVDVQPVRLKNRGSVIFDPNQKCTPAQY